MSTLAACLVKFKSVLSPEDVEEITKTHDALVRGGATMADAAKQAIQQRIAVVMERRKQIAARLEQAGGKAPPPPTPRAPRPPLNAPPDKEQGLVFAFRDRLLNGPGFNTIVEARAFAAENGFAKTDDLDNKKLEETIELAVVMAAKTIINRMADANAPPTAAYQALVGLYERQPRLSGRTSQSMAEQAYSTPAPIAFLASRLGHVADARSVLEPTAGNGMLLIETKPMTGGGRVFVNELNDARAANLRTQGYNPTQRDATKDNLHHKGYPVDTMIANPPFGAVINEQGASTRYDVDGWSTTRIDYAIALNALQHIKDDGRAVLILGGPSKQILGNVQARKDFYNSKGQREFYYRLYNGYKVTDHFTIHGDLYARQGAGWPIDVIVIEGKGKSDLRLPAVTELQVYDSFEALRTKIDERPLRNTQTGDAGGQVRPAHQGGAQSGGGSTGGGRPPAGGGTPRPPSQPGPQPVPVPNGQHPGEPTAPEPDEPVPPGLPRDGDDRGADQRNPTQRRAPGLETEAANAGALQVPYEPASQKGSKLDLLVPTNMAADIRAAIDAIGEDVDEFVAKHIGYDVNTLSDFFSASQVDALALAIKEYQRGGALIIGDQTGIGKGRVVAGMIRFAMMQGQIPVFVTEKPDLYGDMFRDMNDIGLPAKLGRPVNIFATNSNKVIPLDDEAVDWRMDADAAKDAGEPEPEMRGTFLRTGTKLRVNQIMQAATPTNLAGYDVVFTTYDQTSTVKGKTTERRAFLEKMIPNAFLILDESHNAGGAAAGGWTDKDAPEDRAKFLRRMVTGAKGVMYSSATYAKRPDVMDLYSRTDMSKAVENPQDLGPLIERGGVPMQQALASMLARNGQYIRRERSFEGITYNLVETPVDRVAYEGFIDSIRAIQKFDLALDPLRKQIVRDMLAEHGAAAVKDPSIGNMGASATAFASTMHNLVNQMLLSIKADGTADLQIAALQRGEKPSIALSSTMESFIDDYADAKGINTGDVININYRDALTRYLERSLRITVKDARNVKSHIFIPLDSIPADVRALYHVAESVIEDAPLDALPISPIDWLRHRITQAGYTVKEITGRKRRIDYSQSPPVLVNRDAKEKGSSGKRVTVSQYNNGSLDAVIFNRSGSTGISMHSKSTYKDLRQRRMGIPQAEANIDTFMQTLGRINRTGQVNLPAYDQITAAIPAEVRPAAILLKKMASLNANTTASRKGALTADTVDFMNEYGDRVAAEVMGEHHDWHSEMNDPLGAFSPEEVVNAMAKVTGKMTLLKLDAQEALINELTTRYTALIEQLNATGENALEAKHIDLQAIPLSTHEVKPKTGPSIFEGPVIAEHSSVKTEGKSMGGTAVVQSVADLAGEANITDDNRVQRLEELASKLHKTYQHALQSILESGTRFKNEQIQALKDPEARVRFRERQDATAQRFQGIYLDALPGTAITLTPREGEALHGIVIGLGRTGDTKNPIALGSWEVKIAVPTSARQLGIPMSQIFPPGITMPDDAKGLVLSEGKSKLNELLAQFDQAATSGREDRWIITGNMLAAYDQLSSGQIISFSGDSGEIRQGILMPKSFDFAKFVKSRPVWFQTPAQVMEFIDKSSDNNVISRDGLIEISLSQREHLFEIEGAKATGGQYYLHPKVREASQDRFIKRGSRMRAAIRDPKQAVSIIKALMDAGAKFGTKEEQELANTIMGNAPSDKIESIAKQTAAGSVSNPFPLSKIRNRMYHGSPNDIREFRLPPAIDANGFPDVMQGLWFTPNTNKASNYAGKNQPWGERREPAGAVYPAYLDVRNPLVIKRPGLWEKIRAQFGGSRAKHELFRRSVGPTAAFTPHQLQAWKDAGYDGLINGTNGEVVVFDPKQVASAVSAAPPGGKRKIERAPAPMMPRPVWVNPAVRAQIEAGIQELAVQILGHRVRINITNELEHSGKPGSTTLAHYDYETEQIHIALDSVLRMGEDPYEIVNHELIHALRHMGIITKPEWAAMRGWATRNMSDPRHLYEHHRERVGAKGFEELISEEQVANGFAYHRSGQSPPPPFVIQRIIEKIIQFLVRLRNRLRGAGFRTASDIFNDIAAGKMRDRPSTGRFVRGEQRKTAEQVRKREANQAAIDDSFDQMEESERVEAIRMPPSQPNPPPAFDMPSDRAMDHLRNNNARMLDRLQNAIAAASLPARRLVQDTMVDWRRAEQAAETQHGALSPDEMVYRTESLFPGRAGDRLRRLQDEKIEPILRKMFEERLSMDDLWDFLAATYAPDRNAYIASINPRMPDGGSGITNAEAQRMLSDLATRGKLTPAWVVASMVYRFRDEQIRDPLLAEGIIDQAQYNDLYTEPNYVPFQGFAATPDPEAQMPLGRKYDSRATPIKRALGRSSKADNPLAYLIAQAQQTVILGEKARIGRRLLNFVQRFPNSDLWEVDQVTTKRRLVNGTVATFSDGRQRTYAENVFAVRKDGQLYWITLHHPGMAQGVLGTNDARSLAAILRTGVTLQRYYVMTRTGLNPEFFIPNFFRDLQTAGVHITAEQGGAIIRAAANPENLRKAIAATFKYDTMKNRNRNDPWIRAIDEQSAAGGRVDSFGLKDIESIKRDMARMLREYEGGAMVRALDVGRTIHDWVAGANGAIENGIRLSLYKAMRDAGFSRDEAASASREVTVNFNRKGTGSKWLNMLYVFFQAQVNGVSRVAGVMKRHPKVRATLLASMAASVLLDIANSLMAGDDDDDGENDYDQMLDSRDFIAQRNLIFMWPWSKKGERTMLPLPWVYNLFPYAGTQIGRVMRGRISPWEAAANMMGAMLQAGNPFPSLVPTLFTPAYELSQNKDWKDDPIMPESHDNKPVPDSQRFFPSVNPTAKWVAQTLNEVTGGDQARPGAIDVSPETLEYMVNFLTGGVGSFFSRLNYLGEQVAQGQPVEAFRVPFVRNVYGKTSPQEGRDLYYEKIRPAVQTTKEQWKLAAQQGDNDKMAMIQEKYTAEFSLIGAFDKLENKLKDVNGAIRKSTTLDDRERLVKERDRMLAVFRKMYNRAKRQQDPGFPWQQSLWPSSESSISPQ